MRTRIPTLVALATSLAACGLPNGVGLLDLQFGLTSGSLLRSSGVEAVDGGGTPITVDGATLHLSRIDFELPDGQSCDGAVLEAPVFCDDLDTVRIAGPIDVDLATGVTTPSLAGLTVPAGVYERIELRLDPDGAADGASFTAGGTLVAADGSVLPWTLALAIDEDARFEAVGGIDVTDATTAMVLLDVQTWFAGLPVGQCLDDGLLAEDGGVLLLDDSAGCELEDALEDAIGDSGRVEDHGDDDGAEVEDENETEHGAETETEHGTETEVEAD